MALKAVIKEKENRLLTKKFEFEQNRGRQRLHIAGQLKVQTEARSGWTQCLLVTSQDKMAGDTQKSPSGMVRETAHGVKQDYWTDARQASVLKVCLVWKICNIINKSV